MIYGGLGENQQALTSLNKAYQDRSWYITWLKVDPALDGLRGDAGFEKLVKSVGLW